MANVAANRDNKLYELLILLKRHLHSCKLCRGAMKTNNPYDMCREGIDAVLDAAIVYDSVIGIRISARNSDQQTVFPCPRPSLHGKTYELTAIPCVVTGYQDKMF